MEPEAHGPREISAALQRLTAEHIAAKALLEAASFTDAVPQILSAVCTALAWDHGAVWRIDHETGLLRCTDVWPTPSSEFPNFEAASRGVMFSPGVGLPGRVWEQGKPAWIPDVVKDPNFPRAAAATADGLHAAVGFPVLLRGDVHAVMEFFSREIRRPDEELVTLLATIGTQIGMFID